MPSPHGDAVPVEFSINELTSTTAALGKAMLVFDKVDEIVDAQPDQVNIDFVCARAVA